MLWIKYIDKVIVRNVNINDVDIFGCKLLREWAKYKVWWIKTVLLKKYMKYVIEEMREYFYWENSYG
jgi:hypothetical protein